MQRIAVVPMESPPIEIPPFESKKILARAFGTSAFMAQVPQDSIQQSGRVGVMVFGIFMLTQLPGEIKSSAKAADSVEDMLNSEEAWIPTIVFAEEAAKQITAQGEHDVTVIKKVQIFPGLTNRERTWNLENWYAPIRSWYNQKTSQFDYKSLEDQRIDAVLEVGLLNYILMSDRILLQVMLKLIDPATGKVLGRARAFDFEFFSGTDGLFEDNGQPFKNLVGGLGGRLVTEDLKSIGLLPE